MSRCIGFNNRAWLIVARGGWWKPAEIRAELDEPELSDDDLHNRLWVMANRRGYLTQKGKGIGSEYAITADCVVPSGIPVSDLMDALAVESNTERTAA